MKHLFDPICSLFFCLFSFILLGLVFFPALSFSQVQDFNKNIKKPISSPEASEAFQEAFFEALKQKAIANYDKALVAIDTCLVLRPDESILYAEKGKNLMYAKRYKEAVRYFDLFLEKEQNDPFISELSYESHLKLKNYASATKIAEQLAQKQTRFNEQLVNLYYMTKQYDQALELLETVTQAKGQDSYRKQLRSKILAKLKNPSSQINRLQREITKNPFRQQSYLDLITLYTQANKKQKAQEVAEQLLEKNPDSEVVHLTLYKFYLDSKQNDQAIYSMKKALQSQQIDSRSKNNIIRDLLIFIDQNPKYEAQLSSLLKPLAKKSENKAEMLSRVGQYYDKKNNKKQALNYYEKSLKTVVGDFKLLSRVIQLQLDFGRFDKAKSSCELAIEIYPTQPKLYYWHAQALGAHKQLQEAIETLETGKDFIIENPKLEAAFYQEMSKLYTKLGATEKATLFEEKALKIREKS